jgi:hypothetical protein
MFLWINIKFKEIILVFLMIVLTFNTLFDVDLIVKELHNVEVLTLAVAY